MTLARGHESYLQGVVVIGIALGAALAARLVTLSNAVKVLPPGVMMGVSVIVMIGVSKLESAIEVAPRSRTVFRVF